MAWFFERAERIPKDRMLSLAERSVSEAYARVCPNPKKVLLLPPDITRAHSGAGWITEKLYNVFSASAEVWVMPTLGQHMPHTKEQNRRMFGSIPEDRILVHDWRKGVKNLGTIPAGYVEAVTDGAADWEIPISISRIVMEGDWDLIVNIGHVVPHEVLGFSNHNKNYFIGLGGKDTICASHMAAACFGIENNLGRLTTPLRHCFNKAESEYLGSLPDLYILLVTGYDGNGEFVHTGFYCGDDADTYLLAAEQSRKENVVVVPPLKKVVAFMRGDEFFSTWVANKAVYRTRKALADGGELVILAPGLKRFGEREEVDALIRTYGYAGTETILRLWRTKNDLRDLSHAAAHLIHGSSEGRFKITYAPGHLDKREIEGVGYEYLDYRKAVEFYDPSRLRDGFNTLPSGEEIYFIGTPSAGLWTTKEKLN